MDTSAAVRKRPFHAILLEEKGSNMVALLSNAFMCHCCCLFITALFNSMRTLKFKGRPTNAFFAAVHQMIGGPFQLVQLCTTI